MYNFIKKLFILFNIVLILVVVTFYGIDTYWNNKSPENSIFIWGDSQTQQGIDLEHLNKEIKETVYSAARHGAGMYDFSSILQQSS